MVLPLYLAMTAQEMASVSSLPAHLAFMACHFSPSGPGLTNLPRNPLPGQMLILDDRFPFQGHRVSTICQQLEPFFSDGQFESLLLDFQRRDTPEISQLVRQLEGTLPCPVAVSEAYGKYSRGPVFLPPVPPDLSVRKHLSLWTNREIWLDASVEPFRLTVTAQGCTAETFWEDSGEHQGLPCPRLHCRCRTEILEDRAVFHLNRTWEDLQSLLEEAGQLGVRRAVGLWQELG